jgi:competence protein ComEC
MLVIDGLHITVLAAFLLFLLRLCFLPEIAALAITAAGAWLYALVSGCNAPALRAAGGFSLYLAARYFYRRGRVLNLLAAVAIVYLVCDPGQLFEPGFQLSFLAVAAIGALAIPVLEGTSAAFSRSVYGITEVSRDARMDPKAAQFRVELRLLAETLHYCLRIPQDGMTRALAIAARLLFYAWEMAVISTRNPDCFSIAAGDLLSPNFRYGLLGEYYRCAVARAGCSFWIRRSFERMALSRHAGRMAS